MGVKKLTRGERPPEHVQSVRIGITRAQRKVLLECAQQHVEVLKGKPHNFQLRVVAEFMLHLACGLKPATFKSVISYLCRYGNAEGFNQQFLMEQMAIGAWAEWRGDLSGNTGLRLPTPGATTSEMQGMDPVVLLALWRKEMDSEEKHEMIETLDFVSNGLKESLKGESRP